ncbi:MAG: hypothetical protein M1817_006247 [Caeruleum heppii]|nr:MAG: hypothetical protein M1817_006247 [Caeruleum heppii]
METTFISIHDLSPDARLLYASDSIVDILGYTPQEVTNRSCFDYFHPEELPFARSVHGRGISLDKAAVLNYCRIRSKWGDWVCCECAFTVVYDVLVASTSIYRRGMKSQKRAVEAPIIRRLFSSSPRDPRYHMLSHLSHKFLARPSPRGHEPRAALFLNRFTRTLAIMYATSSIAAVLGVSADEAKGKSFYECIHENCLPDAIRCLEGAKANDSIAYMRFWFRNPGRDGNTDEHMTDAHSSDEDDDGGVHLRASSEDDANEQANHSDSSDPNSRSSSNTTDMDSTSNEAIFGQARTAGSSTSSLPLSENAQRSRRQSPRDEPVEIEAVVSCTSDGLVVIIRRARSVEPVPTQIAERSMYSNGLFASPWAAPPIMPASGPVPPALIESLSPEYTQSQPPAVDPVAVSASKGPPMDEFMASIREVAVFAWSLTGINGSLAQYGRGKPVGESQPPDGLPVWDRSSERGAESAMVAKHGPMGGAPVDRLPNGTTGLWTTDANDGHGSMTHSGPYHDNGTSGGGWKDHASDGIDMNRPAAMAGPDREANGQRGWF